VKKLVTVLVLMVALSATGSASAAQIYPSFSPAVLRGTPPWTTTYLFEIHTGRQPEHLNFAGWGSFSLDGPGQLTPVTDALFSAAWSCAFGRGSGVSGVSTATYYHLDLPPETSTVLVAHITRRYPFGVGETIGYGFEMVSTSAAWTPRDGRGEMTPIDVGAPVIATGREPWLYAERAHAKAVPATGGPVPLIGRASPAMAGQLVEIRYTTRWPPVWMPLARVRVQLGGVFGYSKWVPTQPGLYSITASFISHDARFVSTESGSCPDSFKVIGKV
jgi:hypothetical protein